jgi:hypothetical protein
VLKDLDEIKSSYAYLTTQVNKPEHVRNPWLGSSDRVCMLRV